MMKAASHTTALKKLTRELDTAAAFTREAIGDHIGSVPATLLIIFKQRYQYPPCDYPLYEPDAIELSIMADIRSNLRAAGAEIAKQKAAKPLYALSMIEIAGKDQSFWLEKGFFPAAQLPDSFIGQDTLLTTASDSSGRVLRRLTRLVDTSLLLTGGNRQLGGCVQVEQSEQPTEMAAFWQQYRYGA